MSSFGFYVERQIWAHWPKVLIMCHRTGQGADERRRYVPEPTKCTMEPDGYQGEEYGIYKCSHGGELWQFECDGPKEHGWTCCPRCRSIIEYGEVG